ncbi:hypothetical protein ABW19_dt0205969 [Dactylella cylindrospora]|nr:hypothetical protein ABW19_dt0205969 [Dactylella cylindrospora]
MEYPRLDSKDFFKVEFGLIKQKVHDREYNTVSAFSRDILSVLTSSVTSRSKFAVAQAESTELAGLESSIAGPSTAAPTPAATNTANPFETQGTTPTPAPSTAPRQSKALGDTAGKTAGRILRIIQPMLEQAKLQELAMREDPNERMAGEVDERYQEIVLERKKREELEARLATTNIAENGEGDRMDIDNQTVENEQEANDRAAEAALESATATLSQSQQKDEDTEGLIGIPWYTKPFSPMGATLLSEEKWMGMDVVRDMSPLSELDEEEVERLQPSGTPEAVSPSTEIDDDSSNMSGPTSSRARASNKASSTPTAVGAPGTRISSRTTKGTKRVSYLDTQPAQQQHTETPSSKSDKRDNTKKEVVVEQVVVIGSTRSQTKQAIHKAQRRGRGYVWVEVDEEEQHHNTIEDSALELMPKEQDPDAMEIDTEPTETDKNQTEAFLRIGATNGLDDLADSTDSPLTSVPDDPSDFEDHLSLDSGDIKALEEGDDTVIAPSELIADVNRNSEDNMETENADAEFHTPLEIGAPVTLGGDDNKSAQAGERATTEISNSEAGELDAANQLSKEEELAAAQEVPEGNIQEPQPAVYKSPSRSPARHSAWSSPKQGNDDISAEDFSLNTDRSSNGKSTPKKSPSTSGAGSTGKGKDGGLFTPVPMTTRSRKVVESETTPTRRGSSRVAAAKKK